MNKIETRGENIVEVFECNQWLREALISARKRGVEMVREISPKVGEMILFEEDAATRWEVARVKVRFCTLFSDPDPELRCLEGGVIRLPWVIASADYKVSYTRERVRYTNADYLKFREKDVIDQLEALKAKVLRAENELDATRTALKHALAEEATKSCPT